MNVLNESWTLVHIYDKRRWTMERRRIRSVAGTTRVAFTMSSTCKLRVAVCERVLFDDMMQPSRQYKSLIHNEYEWILVNHYLIVSRISHTHTHTQKTMPDHSMLPFVLWNLSFSSLFGQFCHYDERKPMNESDLNTFAIVKMEHGMPICVSEWSNTLVCIFFR